VSRWATLCSLREAKLGRGKVLVFGDTSPFQNVALSYSLDPFVERVFQWLLSDASAPEPRWELLGLLLAGSAGRRPSTGAGFQRRAGRGVVPLAVLVAFRVGAVWRWPARFCAARSR
jgi:hypothetical protein